jgi:hypothetical protein
MEAEIKQLEAAKKFDDPRYMELLIPTYYTQHLLRIPADQWPEPVQRSHARYLYCPNGSHLAMYDDQKTYMDGVVKFIDDVDAGRF